jgi:hypothetical protein
VIRRIVLTLGAAMLAMAAWASPADAHGSVVLVLHGDGRGSVWLTATWADGHPITDPIGAVLTATSTSGQTVGPAPLHAKGDVLAYGGTLAAGDWTVTAEMGTPAIGRCQGTLHVGGAASTARAAPSEIRCAPPAPAPVTSPGSSHVIWYVALAVVAVAAAAALLWYARRSPSAPPVAARRKPKATTSRR